MCGPHRHFAPLLPHTLRRMPQAVGVIATRVPSMGQRKCCKIVSIPQAVGVVATF